MTMFGDDQDTYRISIFCTVVGGAKVFSKGYSCLNSGIEAQSIEPWRPLTDTPAPNLDLQYEYFSAPKTSVYWESDICVNVGLNELSFVRASNQVSTI